MTLKSSIRNYFPSLVSGNRWIRGPHFQMFQVCSFHLHMFSSSQKESWSLLRYISAFQGSTCLSNRNSCSEASKLVLGIHVVLPEIYELDFSVTKKTFVYLHSLFARSSYFCFSLDKNVKIHTSPLIFPINYCFVAKSNYLFPILSYKKTTYSTTVNKPHYSWRNFYFVLPSIGDRWKLKL